jgi:hypothetical protein
MDERITMASEGVVPTAISGRPVVDEVTAGGSAGGRGVRPPSGHQVETYCRLPPSGTDTTTGANPPITIKTTGRGRRKQAGEAWLMMHSPDSRCANDEPVVRIAVGAHRNVELEVLVPRVHGAHIVVDARRPQVGAGSLLKRRTKNVRKTPTTCHGMWRRSSQTPEPER